MLPTNFLRLISAQIRLRSLEDELARAETLDQCWQAIAGRQPRFRLLARGAAPGRNDRELGWAPREAPSTCWMLRVPLSDTDYVNVGNGFGSLVEPMFLSRFATVLREVLEPRLPLLGRRNAAPPA